MKYEIEMPEFHCDFDLDLVTTSTEIVDYLASRCVEAAYLNRVGAYEETYAISQEIENDFDDICDKYLETGGSNSMDIEPYKSVFELLGHQIALKENDNGVSVLFDTDMSVIKFLINDVIVEMKCSILLKTVIDGFMYAYAYAGFPELARMFLVISRNCVIMMDIDEILEEGESMILLLDTELSFMERVLMKSLNVIKNGNSWTLVI